MIIQALVNYYDQMVKNNLISRPGWQTQRIQYAIAINDKGELLQIIPLESVDSDNKPIRREFNVPLSPKKASAIAPKYLWGNSAYMLGVFPDQNELEKLDEKTKQRKKVFLKDVFSSRKNMLTISNKFYCFFKSRFSFHNLRFSFCGFCKMLTQSKL